MGKRKHKKRPYYIVFSTFAHKTKAFYHCYVIISDPTSIIIILVHFSQTKTNIIVIVTQV